MADKTFARALEEFNAANIDPQGVGTDICSVYKTVRPILAGILPFLGLIPNIGEPISKAITTLMAVLDKVCPAASPAASATKA